MSLRGAYFLLAALLVAGLPSAAQANLRYYPDPVYKKFNDEDTHPMDEMVNLAEQGDPRAQFILGDMYQKGKGGLPKDWKQSRHWFEISAMHGYTHSFIRLAALAKHENVPVEAWQWYTLALDNMGYDDEIQDFVIKSRKELVESAQLSNEQIEEARRAMRTWEGERDKQLRAEKEAAREQERQAEKEEQALKEKLAATEKEENKQQHVNNKTQEEENKDEQN